MDLKFLLLQAVLAISIRQGFSLTCPTCMGTGCDEEVKNLECNRHTLPLPGINNDQGKLVTADSRYGCLNMVYETGSGVTKLQQCVEVTTNTDVCNDLAKYLTVTKCRITTDLEKNLFDDGNLSKSTNTTTATTLETTTSDDTAANNTTTLKTTTSDDTAANTTTTLKTTTSDDTAANSTTSLMTTTSGANATTANSTTSLMTTTSGADATTANLTTSLVTTTSAGTTTAKTSITTESTISTETTTQKPSSSVTQTSSIVTLLIAISVWIHV